MVKNMRGAALIYPRNTVLNKYHLTICFSCVIFFLWFDNRKVWWGIITHWSLGKRPLKLKHFQKIKDKLLTSRNSRPQAMRTRPICSRHLSRRVPQSHDILSYHKRWYFIIYANYIEITCSPLIFRYWSFIWFPYLYCDLQIVYQQKTRPEGRRANNAMTSTQSVRLHFYR